MNCFPENNLAVTNTFTKQKARLIIAVFFHKQSWHVFYTDSVLYWPSKACGYEHISKTKIVDNCDFLTQVDLIIIIEHLVQTLVGCFFLDVAKACGLEHVLCAVTTESNYNKERKTWKHTR